MKINRIDYQIENFKSHVDMKEYYDTCINVAEFLEYCKACPNYDRVWSCPPYDFSPEDYWLQYSQIFLYGRKIIFSRELTEKTYTQKELQCLTSEILQREKQDMAEELFALERLHEDSVSLSAGCCQTCGTDNCTRAHSLPCRFPDQMRYSIESLGGNVGLTTSKYLHQELLWMTEGKLPAYFILVGGLLLKQPLLPKDQV